MQKALQYLESHLKKDISVKEAAREACLSPFQFQRTFHLLTGTTVMEYIRRRRLTLAALELKQGNTRVIDAAYRYGYESPESFTRAFRKQHGCPPRDIRLPERKVTVYNPLVIQVTIKGAEPMKFHIEEKEGFKAVGVKREISCLHGENLKKIPEMWVELNTDGTVEEIAAVNNGPVRGILGICEDRSDEKEGVIDYSIAAASVNEVPASMTSISIPKAVWAVFEVKGPMPQAMQEKWERIYSEWFPSSRYTQAPGPELEVYPEGNPYSNDYSSEIWIPVQK
nr:AraC family transcriptional regulator [Halobacillus kuroshimensis]